MAKPDLFVKRTDVKAGDPVNILNDPEFKDRIASGELKPGDSLGGGVSFDNSGNLTVNGQVQTYTQKDIDENLVVDQAALSQYENEIKEFADLYYLSQNTGVDSAKFNTALEKLGVDTKNEIAGGAFVGADILKAAGYTPGSNTDFYGTNEATDIGAQILKDKWAQQDQAKANLQEGERLVNSNVANSLYLQQEMAKQGITAENTNAFLRDDYTVDTIPGGELVLDAQGNWTGQTTAPGLNTDKDINILEWDTSATKVKKPTTPTVPTQVTPNVPAQELTQAQNIFTPKPDGGYNVTLPTGREGEKFKPPTITTPTLTGGLTTEEVSIPTYQTNFNRQASQFTQRAKDEAQLLTPQTLAEKQAAGVAGNIQSRLFQNNQGMSMYISGILNQDGQFIPQQPVPQGYFDTTQKQQSIQANQGVLVSGYQSGGYVTFSRVDDRSQPDAPSFVPIMSDGSELASFPTSEEASTAGKDQEAANKKAYDDSRVDVNQPQDLTTTQIGPEDVYDAQKSVVAQATVAPAGAVTAPPVSYIDPNTTGAVLPSTTGLALGTAPIVDQPAQVQQVTQAQDPSASVDGVTPAASSAKTVTDTDFTKAGDSIDTELAKLTAQTQSTPTRQITAQTQDTTKVSNLTGATGTAATVQDAPTRTLQTGPQGELISGSAVDQARVGQAFGTGEVEAASMQQELTTLMNQFEGGNTPPWAAGAMRRATAVMAQRGLGASSMAGQAIVQAAMEASLPIAQIDTANKQQMALAKAEQRAKFLQIEFDQEFQSKVMNAARVSEIANMNFSADQQVALENAKMAQTVNLATLNNRQAVIMAEAAQLSQLEMATLSNQQQAQVQNAQNFLQLDMANLNNQQQTEIFKAQARNNVLLSDTAANNSRLQFNASTENQVNQFMATLTSQVSQFNSAQTNAMKQFNANEANALLKFNSEIQNQRELFNAQQRAVIAQANAQWRQDTTTANTAAANQSNFEYAKQVNGLTNKVIDQVWQRERDLMSFSMAESESALDRALKLILADKDLQAAREAIDAQEARDKGSFFARFLFGSSLSGFKGLLNLSNIFGAG